MYYIYQIGIIVLFISHISMEHAREVQLQWFRAFSLSKVHPGNRNLGGRRRIGPFLSVLVQLVTNNLFI